MYTSLHQETYQFSVGIWTKLFARSDVLFKICSFWQRHGSCILKHCCNVRPPIYICFNFCEAFVNHSFPKVSWNSAGVIHSLIKNCFSEILLCFKRMYSLVSFRIAAVFHCHIGRSYIDRFDDRWLVSCKLVLNFFQLNFTVLPVLLGYYMLCLV